MINFLHHFLPQPIIFQFGWLTVRWYGLLVALGLLAGVFVFKYLASKSGGKEFREDEVFNLAFWAAVGGIIGARAYQVLILDWAYFQTDFWAIFKVWQGGLAIHGATVGGIVAVMICLWRQQKKESVNKSIKFFLIKFFQVLDLGVAGLALGQAIGRWGNWFNQEVFGRPTNLPWGIPIAMENRPLDYLGASYFHPTFLYESILDFGLFLILFFMVKRGRYRAATPAMVYFAGYALIRFLMEFIRVDHTLVVWGWRWPQLLSLLVLLAISGGWLGRRVWAGHLSGRFWVRRF